MYTPTGFTFFEKLDEAEAGRLIMHFFRYINDQDPKAPDRITELTFEPIKQTLKRDLIAYNAKKEKNSDSAKKRWGKRSHANASKRIKRNAKHADSDSGNDSDNVIHINTPAFSEVETYVRSSVPPDDFWKIKDSLKLKYQSWIENGWKDGNDKPIKNWKQKILNTLPYLKKDENSWKDGQGVKVKESSDEMFDFFETQRKANGE